MRRSASFQSGSFSREFSGAGFKDVFMALIMREQGEFVHVNQPLAINYPQAQQMSGSQNPGMAFASWSGLYGNNTAREVKSWGCRQRQRTILMRRCSSSARPIR